MAHTRLALAFLAIGLAGRTVLPIVPGGPVLGAIPYVVLVLAAAAGFRRGAILAGGVALVLCDVADGIGTWWWAGEAVGSWRLLVSAPATAVFVLPAAMLVGGAIERILGGGGSGPRPRFAGPSRRIAATFAACGALLVVSTSLVGSGFQVGALGLAAWALLPYGVLLLVARSVPSGWVAGGAGAATLAADLGVRASVFLFPRGSTAAVGLVFSPAFLAAMAIPVGGLGGWLLGRAWAVRDARVRAGGAILSATALGLVVVGLARPDLLPWAIASRHAALERIGPPRVVTGAAAFESVPVSAGSAWYQTGELDGRPGDEIAVVDHRGVTLLDAGDPRIRTRVDFGAEPGRLWNWYSRLARLDGRLVVVQTGGGYAETEVRALDGRLVWRHRPDPRLPPRALLPADLDADGRLELYVAEGTSVARLDGEGREVWRGTTRYGAGLAVSEPGNASRPAWVVSFDHVAGITIRDDRGRVLAELPAAGGPVTVGEWADDRVVLTGMSSLRALGLDGRTRLEVPLGELALSDALAVRFAPDASPHLAIVAVAPRELRRARLLLVSADGSVVYDEVRETPERLLKARTADGRELLLVAGEGLRGIRPVTRADRGSRVARLDLWRPAVPAIVPVALACGAAPVVEPGAP